MLLQGRLPDRYRLLEEVGQGGMAVVYKAHDQTLKREVAVKVLHAHLLAEDESKSRLAREAQAVAKLHHDNIVQIFDYSGLDSAASYIVTEFIDGQTLKQFMNNRRPPPPEVAALIAIEIGRPLLHAHSLGIIHRDVKPDNVMVRKDGVLKLMDFGVAQIMDLERMTVTGQLLGSPAYMAPEILEGRPLDVRTDVFSVGIMLYQLATGALPFQGRNPHEVLKRIAEAKFADPRTLNRLIADRLARIIGKALAKKPEDRYSTVAVLLEDLEAFVGDAGLDEAREELKRYFCDPATYEKAVVPRMLAALVSSGKRERAAGKTARALELWNRALGMDPRNREVLAELKRLEARQHLKRGSIIAGAVLALGGGAFLIFRGASETVTPRPAGAVATRALPAASGAAGRIPPAGLPAPPFAGNTVPALAAPEAVMPPGTAASPTPPAAPPKNSPRPGATAAVAPARLRGPVPRKEFTVVSVPLAALRYSIDGRPPESIGGPGDKPIQIPWDGDHQVVFSNPCCADKSFVVGPGREIPDQVFRFRLEPRPARLTVKVSPEVTDRAPLALIEETDTPEEGRRPFRNSTPAGRPVAISFTGDSDMSKTLKVTLFVEGKDPQMQRIVIRAAETSTVPFKLD